MTIIFITTNFRFTLQANNKCPTGIKPLSYNLRNASRCATCATSDILPTLCSNPSKEAIIPNKRDDVKFRKAYKHDIG